MTGEASRVRSLAKQLFNLIRATAIRQLHVSFGTCRTMARDWNCPLK